MIFFWDNACLTDLGGVLWCVALWYLHSIQIQNIWALLDKIASSDRQSHLQLSESCFKFWVSQIFGLSLAFSRPAFWHWPDALHCVGEPWSQPVVWLLWLLCPILLNSSWFSMLGRSGNYRPTPRGHMGLAMLEKVSAWELPRDSGAEGLSLWPFGVNWGSQRRRRAARGGRAATSQDVHPSVSEIF